MAIPKSKRSGGPKTPTGKGVASRNSLKTGAYSSQAILPGENESDFQELENRLQNDFKAEGLVELSMVHELATLLWKRARLEGLEQRILLSELQRVPDEEELKQIEFDPPEGIRVFMMRPELIATLNRQKLGETKSAIDQLLLEGVTHETLADFLINNPFFIPWMTGDDLFDRDELTLYQMLDAMHPLTEAELKKVTRAIERARALFIDLEHFMQYYPHIADEADRIRDRRLLKLMQSVGLQRSYDDLARAFNRTLAELRKQQEWRHKNKVIDI